MRGRPTIAATRAETPVNVRLDDRTLAELDALVTGLRCRTRSEAVRRVIQWAAAEADALPANDRSDPLRAALAETCPADK